MSSFREATEQMIVPIPGGSYAQRVVDEGGSLTTRIDAVDSSTTYIGHAIIGTAESAASWRIKKIVVVDTVTSILWADGNANADNIWNNRTSITYS